MLVVDTATPGQVPLGWRSNNAHRHTNPSNPPPMVPPRVDHVNCHHPANLPPMANATVPQLGIQ